MAFSSPSEMSQTKLHTLHRRTVETEIHSLFRCRTSFMDSEVKPFSWRCSSLFQVKCITCYPTGHQRSFLQMMRHLNGKSLYTTLLNLMTLIGSLCWTLTTPI